MRGAGAVTDEIEAEQEAAGEPAYPVNAAHMMRTAQLAQLQLSAMADAKANILMGAAFVTFTIAIGQARGGTAPLPLLILGGAAFFAAIFAVMAVLPSIGRSGRAGKGNILFFGYFTALGEEEFIDEVTARLASEDSIYRTMARDIYQNGQVLQNKKYRMLGIAYRIFLLGLVSSCAAYVIQHFLPSGA